VKQAKEKLKMLPIHVKVTICAVYALPSNTTLVDIYFAICNHPRMFEWNYMHHWGLQYACVDIDGILCEDPKLTENLDKRKYEDFLLNAVPKFLPTQRIKYLVTCRNEKYRAQTMEWLEKYHIEYDRLIMLKSEQRKPIMLNSDYGKYKGEFYKSTECFIFLESNYEQAVEISNVSQRQVFCLENRTLITPDNVFSHMSIIQRDFWITGKRVAKKVLGKLRGKK
jgi:uncharacterized HAD superfamily protein